MIFGTRPRGSFGPPFAAVICLLIVLAAQPAHAEPFGWPQPGGPGTPVVLSYSFVNLFTPDFQGIPEGQLRVATAEAFRMWALYAPLHFIERPDSGPAPSEDEYLPTGHPDIRIGAHAIDDGLILAHAFIPMQQESGLAGDIHFNSDSMFDWGIGNGVPNIDFREVMLHEIGHALGLRHLEGVDSVMNPFHAFRFDAMSTFLLPADIEALQALYGMGVGSVQPVPEPSTWILVSAGAALLVRRRRARATRRATRSQTPV